MSEPGGKIVATLVVRGLRQCLTMTGEVAGPQRGGDQENVGLVEDAAVAVAGEDIVYAGPASGVLSSVRVAADAVSLDADGGVLLPGFVDPHTHVLFGGWRPGEFAQRIAQPEPSASRIQHPCARVPRRRRSSPTARRPTGG